jgi:hypothetical protein
MCLFLQDDEVSEVREAAVAAWDATGGQYETENEKDLKPRLDFEPQVTTVSCFFHLDLAS